MKRKKFKIVGGIFAFIAVFAAVTAIVMLLWNALIPSVIGWGAISYWQSAGLIVLSRLLLGGFGKGRMFHPHGFKHNKHFKHARMHKMMEGMSRDERREFIRKRMSEFEGFPGAETEKPETNNE